MSGMVNIALKSWPFIGNIRAICAHGANKFLRSGTFTCRNVVDLAAGSRRNAQNTGGEP